MHHWGSHYHLMRRCYPSRTLWFFIGAVSSAAYIKHRDNRESYGLRYWGNCYRPPIHVQQQQLGTYPTYPASPPVDPVPLARETSEPPSQRLDNGPVARGLTPDIDRQWDENKARLQESVSDLSEQTLDSILATIEALRAKLAESRIQRERQLEEEGKQHSRRVPPSGSSSPPGRWV